MNICWMRSSNSRRTDSPAGARPFPFLFRLVPRAAACALLAVLNLAAQNHYVSALGGFAALSGDAGSDFSRSQPRVSFYDPKNGAALNLAGGVHLNDWVSVQGSYIWNRNQVRLAEVTGSAFSQLTSETGQHALGADGLLYFRPRNSRIRPYLSLGPAAVRIRVGDTPVTWRPGLRTAVGIDLMLPSRWGFRYSFSEMLTGNPFHEIVRPSGSRNLMNFQNLFGFVKYF